VPSGRATATGSAAGRAGPAAAVRRLGAVSGALVAALSAALAFAGLAGIALDEMAVRNVGILGYALVFPVAAAWLAVRFARGGRPG
jgi:hypothetical protein